MKVLLITRHYEISILDKLQLLNEFNSIRIKNNLSKLTDTGIIEYINWYCGGSWQSIKDRIRSGSILKLIQHEINKNAKKEEKFKRKVNIANKRREINLSVKLARNIEKDNHPLLSQTRIKQGFVYIIINTKFENWIKIGSAINLKERLSTYQTGDPNRGYVVAFSKYFDDRKSAEIAIHSMFYMHQRNGEWFKINLKKAIKIIKNYN